MKKGKVWRKLTLVTISTDLSWSSFDQDEKKQQHSNEPNYHYAHVFDIKK